MIYVRMRQHDCIEIGNRHRKRFVLFCGLAAFSLEHSAVERDGVSVDVQQMTRPGYFTGRPDKRDFQ
jgi:hypothetical protein